MKVKLLTLITALLLVVTCFAQENTGGEYHNTLKRMFELSGSEQTYQTAIKQMFTMFRQQYTQVEANVWNELEQELTKTSLEDLTVMLVPVYKKYMSISDLKELIKFYETPVGQKYAKNTPFIMQESMQVGQEWGRKLGSEFQKKMKERGY